MFHRITFLSFLTSIGTFLRFFIDEVFRVALLTYLFLLLLEALQPGFVSTYFNLTILFLLVLVAGVISTLLSKTPPDAETKEYHVRRRDVVLTIIFALLAAPVIYLKIAPIGAAAWFIAGLSSFLIFGLSYVFVLKEFLNDD